MSNNVYEILLNIRKDSKLSRKKLSDLSGFKEPTIVSYEKGLRRVSDKYITFISLYFNVSEDFIKGNIEMKLIYDPVKRVLLMYKDIYNFNDDGMIEIFHDKNLDYVETLRSFYYKSSLTVIEKLEVSEILNIKPSSFGWNKMSDIYIKWNMFFDSKEEHNQFMKLVLIQEEKGILLDSDYYADMIKKRNLAKDNYVPIQEPQKLEEKYQKICDLLPYASDKFLDDIHSKLKSMKDIQSL